MHEFGVNHAIEDPHCEFCMLLVSSSTCTLAHVRPILAAFPRRIRHPEVDLDSYSLDMEVVTNGAVPPSLHLPSQQLLSSGDDPEAKAPKKRAETWVLDEIRALIAFRGEMDSLFNTSKSNKHLWEQISLKMRERGYDRSPTMCTDKWRNLLKEYKKAKHHDRGSAKMSCYKDLEELLRQKSKATPYRSPGKLESYVQYSPKGPSRSALNLERRLDQEGHQLSLPSGDAVVENGIHPWAWRDPTVNGGDRHMSYEGKVIFVKCGDTVRRIGVDGTAEAIKAAVKSAFGLRTKRAFWLEDESGVVRSLDREMPAGPYLLHLDEGLTIKMCMHDDSSRLMDTTEEKTFYTDDDFREFLRRRGWVGLREVGGFRDVDSLDELRPMCVYQRSS